MWRWLAGADFTSTFKNAAEGLFVTNTFALCISPFASKSEEWVQYYLTTYDSACHSASALINTIFFAIFICITSIAISIGSLTM